MVLVLLAPHPKGLEHLDLQQWRKICQTVLALHCPFWCLASADIFPALTPPRLGLPTLSRKRLAPTEAATPWPTSPASTPKHHGRQGPALLSSGLPSVKAAGQESAQAMLPWHRAHSAGLARARCSYFRPETPRAKFPLPPRSTRALAPALRAVIFPRVSPAVLACPHCRRRRPHPAGINPLSPFSPKFCVREFRTSEFLKANFPK
jgi:hypothetical protein